MRRIMRAFKIAEISGVDRPAQRDARVAIMKRDTGDVRDKLRRLTEDWRRGFPNWSDEEVSAAAWRLLSHAERNQILGSERTTTMNKIDVGALATFAIECAGEALRKSEPNMTHEQAFSRAFAANPDIAKIERQASRDRLMASMAPRRETDLDEPIAKRDHALGELRKAADELRRHNPSLTSEQAFAKAYSANPALAARERQASRELLHSV